MGFIRELLTITNSITNSMGGMVRRSLPLLLVLLLFTGCRPNGTSAGNKLAEDAAAAEKLDSTLTFNNIVLEQPDDDGKPMWKVRAETTTYSPDKQVAKVTSPDGQIFQEGKAIYRVKAKRGEVRQKGKKMLLMGEATAIDMKNGAVLQGDEIEWQPQRNLLVIRKNIRANHPDLKMSGDQIQVETKKREVTLTGKTVAIATKQNLKLQAEKLIWKMEEKKVFSEKSAQVQKLVGNKVTDQANSDQAVVDLTAQTVQLNKNARVVRQDPGLVISSDTLLWQVEKEMLSSTTRISVLSQEKQVTLSADSGRMEMKPRIAYFDGNVNATGDSNQSQLRANRLVWQMQTQTVDAEGDVFYEQAANPRMTLRGPRAVGKLENRVVVVSGGRVNLQVVPDQKL
jgi:LPS export ABC transporter protein LptC